MNMRKKRLLASLVVLVLVLMSNIISAFRPSGVVVSSSFIVRRCPRCIVFSSIRMAQTIGNCRQIQSHAAPSFDNAITTTPIQVQARFVPESTWREDAATHKSTIESLLLPGLMQSHSNIPKNMKSGRLLDPQHPIYNFLIEYYGMKGSKGVKRLLRWCPDPFYYHNKSDKDITIELEVSFPIENDHDTALVSHSSTKVLAGVFLENASMDDIASGSLHVRGATFIDDASEMKGHSRNVNGILYSPQLHLGRKDIDIILNSKRDTSRTSQRSAAAFLWYRTLLRNTIKSDPILYCHGMHEWAMLYNPDTSSPPPPSSKYQSHLSLRIPQQVINEQVERKGIRCTHIDALRFFAPEARKWNWYGSLDDLTKEEQGVGVQAKKSVEKLFEASSSSNDVKYIPHPANTILTRTDQLHLEQKACLHANMDLFKIAWRLQPFISPIILAEALTAALQARTLDVEASPYDVSAYFGLDWNNETVPIGTVQLGAVKIETEEGRKEYQRRQLQIMKRGEVVRAKLLRAYNDFLLGVFSIDEYETGDAERGQQIPNEMIAS